MSTHSLQPSTHVAPTANLQQTVERSVLHTSQVRLRFERSLDESFDLCLGAPQTPHTKCRPTPAALDVMGCCWSSFRKWLLGNSHGARGEITLSALARQSARQTGSNGAGGG